MKELTDSLWYGVGVVLKPIVARYIDGRYTMSPLDAGAIAACVAEAPGNHLEIGVLQGGSAILAALIKSMNQDLGMVYGVDPFGWAPGQTHAGPEPSPETVLKNADKFGVREKIRVYRQRHPPLPPALEKKRFATVFIDGDHSYEAARADWQNIKHRVDRYVLWHDVGLAKYRQECYRAFVEAAEEPEWQIIYQKGKMGVLERIDGEHKSAQ